MSQLSHAAQAAAVIAKRLPNFKPKIGIVLGSGLGGLADQIDQATIIEYCALPGFPSCSVAGHAGRLILGYLEGVPVACLQGRAHFYEGIEGLVVQTLIRTLKLIGCEILLATNASGSLRQEAGPGSLMLINDHINFQSRNPLVGENDLAFGPRFVAMDDAYDPELRERIKGIAKKLDVPLHEGVYIGVLGPSFETPAEIRAFRILGADAVGMSTVSEVIIARHCGLRVAVIAAITNYAVGMVEGSLSHDHTIHFANLAATNLSRIVKSFIGSFK